MAFGIDRNAQRHGDVLISRWLFPYDYRIVEHLAADEDNPERYFIDYHETKPFQAKGSLLNLFEEQSSKGTRDFGVHFGGLLSGGSRIRSQLYLRELLRAVTGSDGLGGYVGGEMEGVGLLAASEKTEPVWAIVKGISDFADDRRHGEVARSGPRRV